MVLTQKTKAFLKLIKFEHSVFALPFAYLGLFIAENGFPRVRILFWVTLAMVTVRTSAMCLNRLIDEPIDVQNPRTQSRIKLIQSVSRPILWAITIISLGVFAWSAYQLNPLCFALSPIPVILIFIYPFLKRISFVSHFTLGLILGIAPYGGWLASKPEGSWIPLLLAIAVTCWVTGFDMFYAFQDLEFDQSKNLKSFPVKFGIQKTMAAVSILHLITIFCLSIFGVMLKMNLWFWAGWTIILFLILREHHLIRKFGLTKINEAFFNMNAWVSIVIFIATALAIGN